MMNTSNRDSHGARRGRRGGWRLGVAIALAVAIGIAAVGVFRTGAASRSVDREVAYHEAAAAGAAQQGDWPETPEALIEDFWQALAANALCNLHVIAHHGRNSHHISEAIFKAVARALRAAVEIDPSLKGVPSTKGTLGT